jgi:alpha-amylase/alpha-mannosidase (GH57 family)
MHKQSSNQQTSDHPKSKEFYLTPSGKIQQSESNHATVFFFQIHKRILSDLLLLSNLKYGTWQL